MDQVAIELLHRRAKLPVALQRTFRSGERNGAKVRRQRADFVNFCRRPQQQEFIFVVEPAQGSNYVADVSANAKVGHPPNVDSDLHRSDLNTESDLPVEPPSPVLE